MPLFGTASAFLGLGFFELQGNEKTRPVTRTGFFSIVLLEAGVSVSGFASTLYDLAGLVGGAF